MSIETPLGVAMLICDRVITEHETMNKTIVSTFNTIRSKVFPCIHQKITVFIALTNATGEKQINLVLSCGDEELMKTGGKIRFPGPNQVIELIFELTNLPFKEPGTYSFEVFVDNEYIFESRFNVIKID